MGYYSLDPERLIKITSNRSQEKIGDLTEILNEYYQQEASRSYLLYSNNYPSTTMQYIDAYHRGKTEFLKVFSDVHSKVINELKANICVEEYVEADILKRLLNRNVFDLEAQSIAAKCSLERLYNKIIKEADTELYYSDIFEGLLNKYHQILFDTIVLNNPYNNRRTEKIANFEIFSLAEQLSEYNFTYQFPVMETSIFLIRQAIEIHIKNSLGVIDAKITNKKGEPIYDIGISHLIRYLKEKIDKKDIAIGIDINLLEAINKWTNSYIHTGDFYYTFWYIEFIIKYLKNFFFVPRQIYGFHTSQESNTEASIFMERSLSENLDKDMKEFFKNSSIEIKDSYNHKKNLICVDKSEIELIQLKIKEIESEACFVLSRDEKLKNEIGEMCNKWRKDVIVNAQVETDQIYIKEMKSVQEKQGDGTRCINEIKKLADKYKCDVYLEPSPTMGTELGILREIYTKWGFIPEIEDDLKSKMWYPKIPDWLVI